MVSRPRRRCASDTFSVTALDVSAHDSAAYVRVTVSFHAEGYEPWITAGVSSDMNQAALMAIVDGFNYWLLERADEKDEVANSRIVGATSQFAV